MGTSAAYELNPRLRWPRHPLEGPETASHVEGLRG
jgi:hypothetical protein